MRKITNLIEIQLTHFLMVSLRRNYAPLKKLGLVIVEIVWSTWKPSLYFIFHSLLIKSSFLGGTIIQKAIDKGLLTSRRKGKPHGKRKTLTVKRKTERQKEKDSRQK